MAGPSFFIMRQSLDLPGTPNRTRVVVAMSGGVDLSVVAGLLKQAGYDVVGMTLQLYDHGAATHRKGACCAGQDIHDARRVAETLKIPHYTLDYEERFKHAVIDRFADSYAAGETPVPCITCNQTVKFADLLETARRLGADALATGHYVHSAPFGSGRALFRPADLERDQSYFLFATTREQLSFLRFPLGPMTKAETRAAAREFGLPVAEKHDSQDICFVPSGRYADVIRKLKPEAVEKGEIVHIDGRVLGRHDGIINYTVGQRRGIGVATGEPLYVVHLDPAGPARHRRPARRAGDTQASSSRRKLARVTGKSPSCRMKGSTSSRASARRVRRCRRGFSIATAALHVDLADAEAGVAPGQACVFYDLDGAGARVLGGGFIERSEHDRQAELALRKIVGEEPAIAAL